MSAADNPVSDVAVRLPWQGPQWERLEALRQTDRLPHALLLSGASGIGKSRFALALAHYLMCERPVSGTACGECRQCGFNRAGTHPDLKLVAPEEKGKQIKVDQIRELVDFFGHTAQQGGYKVSIIQPAEAMNVNAANALLKSLEEPAARTLLLLITDAPSRLLATIRSRCQLMAFAVPERRQTSDWLTAMLGSDKQIGELMSEAQGRPMAALALLQSDGLGRLRQLDTDYLAMLEGRVGALTVAEKWQEYELSDVLEWLSRRLSGLIAARVAGVELTGPWPGLLNRINAPSLYQLLDRVNELSHRLRQGANPNRQLAMEELMLISCDKFHS